MDTLGSDAPQEGDGSYFRRSPNLARNDDVMKRLLVGLVVLGFLAGCGGSSTKTITTARPPGVPLPSVGARHDSDAIHGTPPPAKGLCGVERWSVKTLSDPAAGDVNPTPVDTTIAQLDGIPAPVQPTDRVPGVETTTYRLTDVHLAAFKVEADSDIHLAIDDGQGHSMIAEIPDPSCMKGSAQSVVDQVTATRARFVARFGQPSNVYQNVSATVSLVGVGFFDRIHGQRGVASNGIELHPLIAGL